MKTRLLAATVVCGVLLPTFATAGGVQTLQRRTPGWVGSVALDSQAQHLAAGSADHAIRVWDIASGRQLARLAGHRDTVTALFISTDDAWLLSGSYDHTARLWKLDLSGDRPSFHAAASAARALGSGDGGAALTRRQDGSHRQY